MTVRLLFNTFSLHRHTHLRTEKQKPHSVKPAMLSLRILQTNTVTQQVVENQQVYIQQKICLRYFKISQTYFRLSPLYFQFPAGSFLLHEKKYFFLRRKILYKNTSRRFPAGSCFYYREQMCRYQISP